MNVSLEAQQIDERLGVRLLVARFLSAICNADQIGMHRYVLTSVSRYLALVTKSPANTWWSLAPRFNLKCVETKVAIAVVRMSKGGIVSVILTAILASSANANEKCWANRMLLEGVVEAQNLVHPNGQNYVGYFLRTSKPVCYVGYDPEKTESVIRIADPLIQIWEIGAKAPIAKFIGKFVEIEGEIHEPQGAYARATLAIMNPRTRELEKRAAGSDAQNSTRGLQPSDNEELIFYCIAFLEAEGVLKRLSALYKPDPQEPTVLLIGLHFMSGPAYDSIKLQSEKVARITALGRSAKQQASSMSGGALLTAYRTCRRLVEK